MDPRPEGVESFDAPMLLDDDELCLERLNQWQIKTDSFIINSKGIKDMIAKVSIRINQ